MNDDVTDATTADGAAALRAPMPTLMRTPLSMPEGGWPADEFTGQAGSFARDPYTGKRTRLEDPTGPRPGAIV